MLRVLRGARESSSFQQSFPDGAGEVRQEGKAAVVLQAEGIACGRV